MSGIPLTKRVDQVLQDYKDDPFRRGQELKDLLKEAENARDLYCVGKINLYLSICTFQQGRRDSVLSYAYKSVSILERLNERRLLARSYNLLGIAYAGQGNFQRALASYNKAMKLIRGQKNPGIRKESLLNNIGDSYYQMGAFQKCLKISLDCLKNCRKNNPDNYFGIVLYGINAADSYCSMDQFEKARAVLDDTSSEVQHLQKSIISCGHYTRQAWVSYALGDVENGAKNADIMLELVRDHCDTYEFHSVFDKIASLQIDVGDLDRAYQISEILTQYAENSGHSLDLILANRVQAKLSCAEGNLEQALSIYKNLSGLYEERMKEQKAIQYEAQRSVENASRQISKLMQKVRDSEEKAERDPLTGLLNRSTLVTVATDFLQKAKCNGESIGGVFLDIDYFKEYNDTYGHSVGDEAIKLVAGVCLGEENLNVQFFRYGGDEYFGIVFGYSDEELEALALRISNRVRMSGVAHARNPNGQRLTVSIGIVNVNMKDSGDSVLDVIKYADKALYHAKDRGKDDVFAYHILPNSQREFKRIVQEEQNTLPESDI